MAKKKFTGREGLLIIEALKSQKKEQMEVIDNLELEGKQLFVTSGFIGQEHDQLIEKVKELTEEEPNNG